MAQSKHGWFARRVENPPPPSLFLSTDTQRTGFLLVLAAFLAAFFIALAWACASSAASVASSSRMARSAAAAASSARPAEPTVAEDGFAGRAIRTWVRG